MLQWPSAASLSSPAYSCTKAVHSYTSCPLHPCLQLAQLACLCECVHFRPVTCMGRVAHSCCLPVSAGAGLRRRLGGHLRGHRRLWPGRVFHRAVRPRRWRHLHQGGRRRRRPGGQGGEGHPRGRPAQPRRHCRCALRSLLAAWGACMEGSGFQTHDCQSNIIP